jgi:hypothetical protein
LDTVFRFKRLEMKPCGTCGKLKDSPKVCCDSHTDPNPKVHFFVKCKGCSSRGDGAWGVVSAIRAWNRSSRKEQ